jgi:glycosyltransferase involved in cell wall biosynthesis
VRVGLYTDYPYRRVSGALSADRSFAEFVNALAGELGGLTAIGRLDPGTEPYRHDVDPALDFIALPHYESLAQPWEVLATAMTALRRFWRCLDDLDGVWILGPQPFALAFTVMAVLRRKHVTLGVRQDWIAYVRHRHPRSVPLRAAAVLLELSLRLLAIRLGMIAVGPDLAGRYRHARRLLEVSVSLVDEDQITPPEQALSRSYGGELTLLSVGRLDNEKNPLLLAQVLAGLRQRDPRWHLVVCGEGPLQAALEDRLDALGLGPHATLKGYVPFGPDLIAEYRRSHAFLHVSWTEGFPQVLLEAFAAGLPVVATAVGSVPTVIPAALLIPPGEADAAVEALVQIAAKPELRAKLVRAGNEFVERRTRTAEVERVAAFLRA